MTKQTKKLSCKECGSQDIEFAIWVSENVVVSETQGDVKEQIREEHILNPGCYGKGEGEEAWCNVCEWTTGVV